MSVLGAALERHRMLVIIRAPDGDTALDAVAHLVTAGVELLEISLATPGAISAIAQARKQLQDDALLGAGTVMTTDQAERAIAAGAHYLVSPHISEAIGRVASEHGVDYMPGALTPTEAAQAAEIGSGPVKLFPANRLGPQYVSDLLAPMPTLRLVPTGGLTAKTAGAYIAAGAVGVAVGGALNAALAGGSDTVGRAIVALRTALLSPKQGPSPDDT